MIAAEWWQRVRRENRDWRDVEAWSDLSHTDRQRIRARLRQGAASSDPDVRALAGRIEDDITVAEWSEPVVDDALPPVPLSEYRRQERNIVAALQGDDPDVRALAERVHVLLAVTPTMEDPEPVRLHVLPRQSIGLRLDVDAARERPIAEIAASLGITANRRGWAQCPFHADNSPSLHLNAKKNRAFCNPCGRSWDAIALVQEMRGLPFADAVKELAA